MAGRLRLMNNWLLVKMDPESNKTLSGTLFRPEIAYETILRTGVVISVGPGPWAVNKSGECKGFRIPTGLEPGMGVVFNKVVAELTKTAEALHQYVLEEDEALLRPNDVLLVFDPNERPVFE